MASPLKLYVDYLVIDLPKWLLLSLCQLDLSYHLEVFLLAPCILVFLLFLFLLFFKLLFFLFLLLLSFSIGGSILALLLGFVANLGGRDLDFLWLGFVTHLLVLVLLVFHFPEFFVLLNDVVLNGLSCFIHLGSSLLDWLLEFYEVHFSIPIVRIHHHPFHCTHK